MELRLSGNDEVMVISIYGELNATNCDQLRETVLQLSEKNINKITIDLRQTTFVDSTGLGVLVGLHATLKKRKGHLLLANPQPSVKSTLDITRLSALFGIISDELE
ncbi:MAG: STAS domain-containing protein [Candidatus Sumerlaeia bacterium]